MISGMQSATIAMILLATLANVASARSPATPAAPAGDCPVVTRDVGVNGILADNPWPCQTSLVASTTPSTQFRPSAVWAADGDASAEPLSGSADDAHPIVSPVAHAVCLMKPGTDSIVASMTRLPSPPTVQDQAMELTAVELCQYQTACAPSNESATKSISHADGVDANAPDAYAARVDAAVTAALQAASRFEAEGNLAEAINAFHQALQWDHTDRLALIGFARLKHRLGDLDGAIVTYRQSLKHHPNDAIALNDLAICYARMGQPNEAEESLRTALNLEPTSRRYINNLAKVLVVQHKDQDAMQLLKHEYGDALAHYNLGYIHLDLAEPAPAAAHFRAALDLDPSFQPAADLLRQLGEAGYEIPQEPDVAIKPAPVQTVAHDREANVEQAPDPATLTLESPEAIQRTQARGPHRAGWNFLQREDAGFDGPRE